MRSPFPGMDPYIEACGLWEDFHDGLLSAIKDVLADTLPDRYVARTGERCYIVLSTRNGEAEYRAQTDVGIGSVSARSKKAHRRSTTPVPSLLEAEPTPVTMRALVETEFRETFLEIREIRPQRRLVTCLEVLSPANKQAGTPGWWQYSRKRQAFLEGAAHFVEIDLLRGGRRMPMEDDWPESPYYLLVCRKPESPRCTIWPASFSRPLPPIPVPLAGKDPDIVLEIQPLLQTLYARSHYERDIDYSQSIQPPFSPAESAWVRKRLQEWKTRGE